MKRSSHVACPRLRESMPPYTPLCVGASDARRLVDVKTTTTTTTNRRVTGPFHKLWTTNKSIAERKQYLSSFSFTRFVCKRERKMGKGIWCHFSNRESDETNCVFTGRIRWPCACLSNFAHCLLFFRVYFSVPFLDVNESQGTWIKFTKQYSVLRADGIEAT